MPSHSLRIINVIIGTVLLTVGLLFVSVNFISPQTTSTEITLATMNNFHFNGYPPETLQQSTDNIYRSFSAVNIIKGQTLQVSWSADLFLGVYIFSQQQFAYFQSILPNTQSAENTTNPLNYAQDWANANGITYKAEGYAKYGEVTYNDTKTGNYVVVITNAMYGAAYATVWDFSVNLISYKETPSLYLYLGVLLVILGVALLALTLLSKNL